MKIVKEVLLSIKNEPNDWFIYKSCHDTYHIRNTKTKVELNSIGNISPVFLWILIPPISSIIAIKVNEHEYSSNLSIIDKIKLEFAFKDWLKNRSLNNLINQN